ncbi:MAG: serine acetyltransferase [Planctomycetes bacterium]|nr:serine acetyltransferase [Planctomycetota bacterium]
MNEGTEEPLNLTRVVEKLSGSSHVLARLGKRVPCAHPLPSREALIRVFEGLRAVLLPGYYGDSELTEQSLPFHLGATLDRLETCARRGREITRRFMERLPEVQNLLLGDVQAAYEGDPACTAPDEAIFCYPGVQAMVCQRIAHLLYEMRVPLLPRILTEHAHGLTGIDIHPGARIGERFFIDHGTGVVIGETCIIGKNVRLYQGVTLGAKSFPLDEHGNPIKGIDRHPIIEDDVVIYAGATILGRITIGKGSVIGGNVWVTESVPPCSKVMQERRR